MLKDIANIDQAAAWDGQEGDDWYEDWEAYDRSVRAYRDAWAASCAIATGDRVLDVGCGTGESTREAARASVPGEVVGIDLSARMLERARQLTDVDGLTNVDYVQGDAQVHPVAERCFDVAVSRLGSMFFDDKAAAFANIGRSLRPGGRLVLMAWQGPAPNEWLREVVGALAART